MKANQVTSGLYLSPSRFTVPTQENRQDENSETPLTQTVFLPRMYSSMSFDSIRSTTSLTSLETESLGPNVRRSIRFQVVVWHVGQPDEVLGKVDMKFRVSLFWNAPAESDDESPENTGGGFGMGHQTRNTKVWTMHGRQSAYKRELKQITGEDGIVFVPPLSILNAGDFEVLGEPEVGLVNSEENLMRWSCLYKASLLQDKMQVAEFPHDEHELQIKLAILKHRQPRRRWDRRKWKLGLATKEDTLDSIQTPHGTIVDHCKVPGFSYGKEGLVFEFAPLEFGARGQEVDQQLQISLRVRRESTYYDRNIIPLLAALNFVGICTLALSAAEFGARGEIILATAFVEIGIRMTVDSRLPVVGYQIKMQFILNNFFYGLLFLVFSSSLAYMLHTHGLHKYDLLVDQCSAIIEAVHIYSVLSLYYCGNNSYWSKFYCMASRFESSDTDSTTDELDRLI